ncbi:MAG: hypothetical protein PHH26_00580 [Candidatus Thermoplasmatota archaeon]|nr:hypothetical protein [Candidatus Thermoplasmatota archaeon]
MGNSFGKCSECGKEDVPLYDGLCIECARKRPKDKGDFEMLKKLPKRVFVRYRKYEGNNEVSLDAHTDITQMIDQDETCEVGLYELKKIVKAKNSTTIVA